MHELLSLFVDDALDPGSRKEVEEHIALCDHCAAELDDLVSYQRAVGSLRKVKAPPHFLQNLHERLEHPSPFRKWADLFRTLLRMGSPIKWAGVAAALLVLVITYHGRNLYVERGYAPQVAQITPPAESPKAPAGKPSSAGTAEEKLAPQAMGPERADVGTKHVELAIVLSPRRGRAAGEPEQRSEAAGHKFSRDLPAPVKTEEREIEDIPRQPRAAAPAPPTSSARKQGRPPLSSYRRFLASESGSGSPSNAEEGDIGKGKPAESSRAARLGQAGLRETDSSFDDSETIERVQEVIRSVGGTVLAVESRKEDHLSRSIAATLPPESFVKLVDKLRHIGRLSGDTAASLPPQNQRMIEVKIKIMFPE
jgi:hypothetical protein